MMLLAKPYSVDPRVQSEAKSLRDGGYDVTVLSWERSGQGTDERRGGVRVVGLRLLDGNEFSKIAYALSALLLQVYCVLWCLRNLNGRYLVHANDFNTLPAGAALKLLRPRGVKLVYDCHELTPSAYAEWYGYGVGLVAGALERRLVRFADALVTVSPPIEGYLSRISGKQVSVIYNTISTGSVPPGSKEWWKRRLGLEGFVVSYVGTLRQDVGLDELIGAARRLEESKTDGVEFVIVGSGPDSRRMKAEAADLRRSVLFVPQVPHDVALGYVKASDVSYAVYRARNGRSGSGEHDRLAEGNTLVASPWKVFEAMACGTAVLVRGGTYTWALASGVGFGISAGAGTEAEIAAGISWALRNRGRVDSMADSARSRFAGEYNWDRMGRRLVGIYNALA